jgi:hypothetical protein
MRQRCFRPFHLLLITGLLSLVSAGCGSSNHNLVIRDDYQLGRDVTEMARYADTVVVGEYVKLESSQRQMPRRANPGTEYLVFSFKVDKVLKGSAKPQIKVALLYRQSLAGVRDGSGRQITVQLKHPRYIAPVFHQPYILFLKKGLKPDTWNAALEPFQILIGKDRKAVLKSILVTGKAKSEVRLNGLTVIYDANEPGFKDTISGRSADDLIREIEKVAGKK